MHLSGRPAEGVTVTQVSVPGSAAPTATTPHEPNGGYGAAVSRSMELGSGARLVSQTQQPARGSLTLGCKLVAPRTRLALRCLVAQTWPYGCIIHPRSGALHG